MKAIRSGEHPRSFISPLLSSEAQVVYDSGGANKVSPAIGDDTKGMFLVKLFPNNQK